MRVPALVYHADSPPSTGSDDCTTIILNGVPFKYASASRKHTRFVQSVDVRLIPVNSPRRADSLQYSSDGSLSASAGSDGCVYLYAGTDGADHAALVDPALPTAVAHSGTVFSVSFSPDSKSLLTSSADQTTKLWDVATGAIVQSWKFDGVSLACQQVGSCWVHVDGKEQIVSLSFNGDLNVLEKGTKEPVRILYGRTWGTLSRLGSLARRPASRDGAHVPSGLQDVLLGRRSRRSTKLDCCGRLLARQGCRTLELGHRPRPDERVDRLDWDGRHGPLNHQRWILVRGLLRRTC